MHYGPSADVSSQLVHARARRRFQRGLKSKPMRLIKKLRKAKKEAAANEKPSMVKTHLRDMLIVPEMIGSVVGVYVSITAPIFSSAFLYSKVDAECVVER